MKIVPLIITLALGISGCDVVHQLGNKLHEQFRDEVGPMTFAFVPGYSVTADNRTFQIYGKEMCPEPVAAKVFVFGGGFGYPGQGSTGCVVVQPESEKVNVQRMNNGDLVDEVWRVERSEETLKLWTPDGKSVAAADL